MQAQYAFIHDAFNELIICGETEIAASKLTDKIKVLSETNRENGMTGFEEQFQVICERCDDISYIKQLS